jgi:peptidoglycan hydrolase CwlO-like protein
MGIDSCDHGDFVVVYEMPENKQCPVCELENDKTNNENEIKDLKGQIEDLESEIATLEEKASEE